MNGQMVRAAMARRWLFKQAAEVRLMLFQWATGELKDQELMTVMRHGLSDAASDLTRTDLEPNERAVATGIMHLDGDGHWWVGGTRLTVGHQVELYDGAGWLPGFISRQGEKFIVTVRDTIGFLEIFEGAPARLLGAQTHATGEGQTWQ